MPLLDHPWPGRAHRIYAALTNHCNRACPWCSTCSAPDRDTWITWDALAAAIPREGDYEMQLEGGEPTLHPQFWSFVERLRADPRCGKLVLCTNGTLLPHEPAKLCAWLRRLGEPLLVKLSINYYLLERDPRLLTLARVLQLELAQLGGAREIVFNVRLRKGFDDDDRTVVQAVSDAGLAAQSNIFFLQRYGFADDQLDWEPPFLAGHNFRMVNPDGSVFGPDLLTRSEAMRRLK